MNDVFVHPTTLWHLGWKMIDPSDYYFVLILQRKMSTLQLSPNNDINK